MRSQSHNKMEVGPSHLAVISAFILFEKYLLKVKKKIPDWIKHTLESNLISNIYF